MSIRESKTLDYRFKILYAVGMILVLCDHTQGGGISIINDWFPYAGLHLSLFAFASGYFYKDTSEKHIKKYIGKKIRTLILPLYIYTVIYGLIVQILKLGGFEIGGNITLYNVFIAPITNGHQFIYNMGGWFIAPLFMVEVFNCIQRKILKSIHPNIPEITFFSISLLLGVTGNYFACTGHVNGWWLVWVRMFYFVPFYGLGIFYKSTWEKYDRKIPCIWYFTAIFTVKLFIAYTYGRMPSYTPAWCHNFTEGPVMPIIVGYLGIAFWMRIATILEPVIGRSKWINLIANNTYSIMMNQFLGFMIVKTFYAILSKLNPGFSDFDWVSYKTNIWWYYKPRNLEYTLILYVAAGIIFPIMFQAICTRIYDRLKYKFAISSKLRK